MNMREADHEEIIDSLAGPDGHCCTALAITGWLRLSAICQQKLHLRDNYGTSWQRLITFAA